MRLAADVTPSRHALRLACRVFSRSPWSGEPGDEDHRPWQHLTTLKGQSPGPAERVGEPFGDLLDRHAARPDLPPRPRLRIGSNRLPGVPDFYRRAGIAPRAPNDTSLAASFGRRAVFGAASGRQTSGR